MVDATFKEHGQFELIRNGTAVCFTITCDDEYQAMMMFDKLSEEFNSGPGNEVMMIFRL